jgi:hypothetical protein
MDNGQFKTSFSQGITPLLTRLSVTKGKLYASHASIPPSSGRTLVIPLPGAKRRVETDQSAGRGSAPEIL